MAVLILLLMSLTFSSYTHIFDAAKEKQKVAYTERFVIATEHPEKTLRSDYKGSDLYHTINQSVRVFGINLVAQRIYENWPNYGRLPFYSYGGSPEKQVRNNDIPLIYNEVDGSLAKQIPYEVWVSIMQKLSYENSNSELMASYGWYGLGAMATSRSTYWNFINELRSK